jgi:uncharacterized protein
MLWAQPMDPYNRAMKLQKRLVIGFILALAVGAGGFALHKRAPQIAKTLDAPQAGSIPDHPLNINLARAKQYPGGELVMEQSLGIQGPRTNQVVSYRSDGLKLYALVSTPLTAQPAGGYPVIILNHGYINPSAYQTTGGDYTTIIDHWTRNGYLVIKPDFRGHGNSEGNMPNPYFAPDFTVDLLSLIDALKRYPAANINAIGTVGHSQGGAISLRAAVISPDIKASVIAAGVTGTMEDILFQWTRGPMGNRQPARRIVPIREEYVKKYGEPKDNPAFWDTIDPLSHLDKIVGPVQIHQGTNDEAVPQLFSDRLHEKLTAIGKPVEYFVYQNGDHQFTTEREAFLTRITSFFNRTLKQ